VPKPKDLAGQQMRMLQGINGIGPGRAQDLLAHFGTPAAVVNATLEALTATVGRSGHCREGVHVRPAERGPEQGQRGSVAAGGTAAPPWKRRVFG
jgi:hypothetical protein